MIVAIALVVGLLLGVGLTLWLSHPTPRPAPPLAPVVPTVTPVLAVVEPSGHFRVTREFGGHVEVLEQSQHGARAAQQFAYHNPTQPGEVIAFYRGSERCSAKEG